MQIKKFFGTILITIVFIIFAQYNIALADVGSFHSYSGGSSHSSYSGSSHSGSSHSSYSGSSHSGSGYSGSGDYSSYGGSSNGNVMIVPIIIIVVVIAIIIASKYGNMGFGNFYQDMNNIPSAAAQNNEENVEAKVKEIDPLFNKEELLSWAKDLFVKLQAAWTARDWSAIRVFESNELFEQHKQQLQGYIDKNQINVLDRVCVESAKLSEFQQSNDKDILTVILNTKMLDYIIDATTKKIIAGDTTTEFYTTYALTFIRKTGVKTKPGTNQVNTTNCPNCGAPTQITSAGKCEYCGSIITTGEYNWVLSNLEKIN